MVIRIASVVGARPQFVKLAPVHRALRARGLEHVIIHTGQHYDHDMSGIFFDDLQLPEPDENLAVGSASHARQTGRMMELLESSFVRFQPDWILAYGDTNSTLAAALVAVKMSIRVAHLEAGLRSFNRLMPEEHNRVLVDHASELLLAPTETARSHLEAEGLANRTVVVGDVMADICLETLHRVGRKPPQMPRELNENHYIVATIHRQENTDQPERLRQIIDHLSTTSRRVYLLAHPRLRARAAEFDIELARSNVSVLDPLPYPQLIYAVSRSVGVITDSGGLQKEAFLVGTPCITLRTETEWTETVEQGWNVIDPTCSRPIDSTLESKREPNNNPYGDGRAAERVVDALEQAS